MLNISVNVLSQISNLKLICFDGIYWCLNFLLFTLNITNNAKHFCITSLNIFYCSHWDYNYNQQMFKKSLFTRRDVLWVFWTAKNTVFKQLSQTLPHMPFDQKTVSSKLMPLVELFAQTITNLLFCFFDNAMNNFLSLLFSSNIFLITHFSFNLRFLWNFLCVFIL